MLNLNEVSVRRCIFSNLDMWLNGRSSLWYSVDPQQVWTRTFICAHTSFTCFSTFSSSEATWTLTHDGNNVIVTELSRHSSCHRKKVVFKATSSWKATVLTEPSCLIRSATTSSGFPRLTTRLLSCARKNKHTHTDVTPLRESCILGRHKVIFPTPNPRPF